MTTPSDTVRTNTCNVEPLFGKIDLVSRLKFRCPFEHMNKPSNIVLSAQNPYSNSKSTSPAKLHYNSRLIHRLTFLQIDVNLFFFIGAVMQRDSRSSTSKCEVFAWRYGCQYENIVLDFTNRIMHRWYHFHRSWYHFHRSWSWDVWKIRRLLVSADFKCASEFVSYLKFCLYLVHDAQRRDLEVPWWLALNETIYKSVL